MNSFLDLIAYYSVKICGAVIRRLPIEISLGFGRFLGTLAYIFDFKHKALVYSNLKIAFAQSKTPHEIKTITRRVFQNFGQSIMELFYLPLMNRAHFEKYISMENPEHVAATLKQGKGVILLAMHFGSWELASIWSAMNGYPYKVVVKQQKRFTRLGKLLNEYRQSGGSVVIQRGVGIREFIRSLQNNEAVGMVVDQGGRDGVLVPFFDRQASMSSGAIRMGLKLGVPICFAIITRQKGPYHKFIFNAPLKLINTGNVEDDVRANLVQVTQMMERFIRESPEQYMWFYKIWKYSKESVIAILDDGRTGHLRQSQAVAKAVEQSLAEQGFLATTKVLTVTYKNKFAAQTLSLISVLANKFIHPGRLGFLRWFLTPDSYRAVNSVKADFVISCGASTTAVNFLLSNDLQAKSIVVLKPSIFKLNRFDLVILPEHDRTKRMSVSKNLIFTVGAPNLITEDYLKEQADLLLHRFSHLKPRARYKIGLLVGGDTKNYLLNEQIMKIVVNQVKEVAMELNADILLTTSRRTSEKVENLLVRELKKNPSCPLFVSANKSNVPEAVGGILGLADVLVVSSDSISMISEAASSGKKTVVFHAQPRITLDQEQHKHTQFMDKLNAQGYILATDAKNLRNAIYDLAKNKIQTRKIDDQATILNAARQII